MNRKTTKNKIIDLVKKYSDNRSSYLKSSYNETQLRTDFLNPLFEALGWDIYNQSGKSTNEREVILEEGLKTKVSENSKKPDYTFRLFSERKFFLEAKKPSVKIENDSKTARQVRRYGFTAKLKISVLSNFEYLAIYDCSVNVKEDDSVKKALIKRYHYTEFEKNFNEIYKYLSRTEVYNGRFDKTWEHIEDQLKLFSVDHLFLKQINEWRLLLGAEIFKNKSSIDEQELNDIVQSYLNSIIFLRVCEDRNLEDYQTLLNFATKKDFSALIAKFQEADKKYNSGLFDQKLTKEIIENNKSVFWIIIKQLYYPESPYSFSVFSSDILGNIYEIFLAEKLSIKNKKVVVLEKKAEHDDRDIITTPTHIIQDILRETIIPFCDGKSDKEMIKARFADIACGSGAFLLETFQLLSDILVDYYLHHDKSKLIQTSINTFKLPFDIKRKLLVNCIYGVDKDYNAVQATKFGLLLKLLESEDNKTIPAKKPILPDLSDNIHFGNTLLGQKETSKKDYTVINPYDFLEKFDVIVGNPPYMKSEDMKNITPKELPLYKKHYKSAYKQFDKYFLFIERGLSLLSQDGFLGFIVPSKFIKVGAGKNLRELLKESLNIRQIVSFGANQVFQDKTTYTCLLILNKRKQKIFEYCEVDNFNDWKIRDISKIDFDGIKLATLDNEVWILYPARLKRIFDRISEKSVALGELIGDENIFNGIQTSATNIYIHKPEAEDKKYYYFEKDRKKWKIEKGFTRPYYQTSSGEDNLYTYRKFQPNSFVIYPYKKTSKGIEFIRMAELKKDFPFALKYLSKYKKDLIKRDIQPKPINKNEWYRYGRHQSLDKCEVPAKIVVGILSIGDKYAIDYHRTVLSSGGNAGYCVISVPEKFAYSIYYIQAILNSKYTEWYCSLVGSIFRGGYISHGTQILKRLPIPKINFAQKQEKAVHDKIVKLQKELIKIFDLIEKAKSERLKTPCQRAFNKKKSELDACLKNLYQLGSADSLVPIISEKYEAD